MQSESTLCKECGGPQPSCITPEVTAQYAAELSKFLHEQSYGIFVQALKAAL